MQLTNVSHAYADSVHNLCHRANVLEMDLRQLREAAKKRGHLTAALRAGELAQQLAIELAELEVTNATDSLLGRVA